MAHIFQSRSENKEKLEAYLSQQVQLQRLDFEKEKASRPRDRAIALVVLAACIIAAALLLFKKGLMTDIRWAVMGVLARWADGLWLAGTGGKSIFHLAIQLVCKALSLLCTVLTWVAPLLVPVALFALVGVIGFFAFCAVAAVSGDFDEAEARAKAESAMDSDWQGIKAGVVGEEMALSMVSALGDECYVFTNLEVKVDGKRNETDLIVVSPSGLTVVEVKNYSGVLSGDLSDRDFLQRKYHKNGECTEKWESNPVSQVSAPIHKLARYLKDEGISISLRRCALFVNENVEFQLTDRKGLAGTCPLFFRNSQEFLNYLHRPGARALSQSAIERIVAALKKQM